MTWLAVLQVTLYNPEAVLLQNMLPYAAGCSYTRHATGRGRIASLPYWVWQNTCIPVAAGMKPETSSILGTDLHYALAEAAQALYMLWCCTIACSSSAQLAVLLLYCMFLISPIGCVAAVLHVPHQPNWLCCCCTMQPAGSLQVHKLRQQEQDGQQTKPRHPRALVLGPTRELTDQILQVAKSLSHHARFRSACVNGGNALSFQRTMHVLAAAHGVDLLYNEA